MNIHTFTHKLDIIIGKAELPYVARREGWAIPGGTIIKNRSEAIRYACDLHDYIEIQVVKKMTKLNKL